MTVAIAAAPPLIAAGPPGWLVLGAIAAASVGAAIWAMAEKADDAAGDEETDCTIDCPNTGSDAEPVDKAREYPANPDDLVDEGYEETSQGQPGTDHSFSDWLGRPWPIPGYPELSKLSPELRHRNSDE